MWAGLRGAGGDGGGAGGRFNVSQIKGGCGAGGGGRRQCWGWRHLEKIKTGESACEYRERETEGLRTKGLREKMK